MSNADVCPPLKSYASTSKLVDSDRAAIEAIIADWFVFTSPLDNRIDRKTYFERCWPNHRSITVFDFARLIVHGATVVVTYEGRTAEKTFAILKI
jgi:hypothetical protein